MIPCSPYGNCQNLSTWKGFHAKSHDTLPEINGTSLVVRRLLSFWEGYVGAMLVFREGG